MPTRQRIAEKQKLRAEAEKLAAERRRIEADIERLPPPIIARISTGLTALGSIMTVVGTGLLAAGVVDRVAAERREWKLEQSEKAAKDRQASAESARDKAFKELTEAKEKLEETRTENKRALEDANRKLEETVARNRTALTEANQRLTELSEKNRIATRDLELSMQRFESIYTKTRSSVASQLVSHLVSQCDILDNLPQSQGPLATRRFLQRILLSAESIQAALPPPRKCFDSALSSFKLERALTKTDEARFSDEVRKVADTLELSRQQTLADLSRYSAATLDNQSSLPTPSETGVLIPPSDPGQVFEARRDYAMVSTVDRYLREVGRSIRSLRRLGTE